MTYNIEDLYEAYPVLKKVDRSFNGVISKKVIYK